MSDQLVQCSECGRIADELATKSGDKLTCRFCRAAAEKRCYYCGWPGDKWPLPSARYTDPPVNEVPPCSPDHQLPRYRATRSN